MRRPANRQGRGAAARGMASNYPVDQLMRKVHPRKVPGGRMDDYSRSRMGAHSSFALFTTQVHAYSRLCVRVRARHFSAPSWKAAAPSEPPSTRVRPDCMCFLSMHLQLDSPVARPLADSHWLILTRMRVQAGKLECCEVFLLSQCSV